MNNFARNIGIWYRDKDWAEELFNKIYEEYPRYSIFRIYKNSLTLKLVDGTLIRFFDQNDLRHSGIALTDSYIQEGVNFKLIQERICAVTKYGAKGLYIINSYDDIRNPQKLEGYYMLFDNMKQKLKKRIIKDKSNKH